MDVSLQAECPVPSALDCMGSQRPPVVVLVFAVPADIHMSQFISGVCKLGHARSGSSFCH